VAFTVDGRTSTSIGEALACQGLGVGTGNFYAYRLVEALGIEPQDGAVRTSFVHYTADAEIGRLIGALDSLL
jgi:selenocysteine lyase/cysteine desulfurase